MLKHETFWVFHITFVMVYNEPEPEIIKKQAFVSSEKKKKIISSTPDCKQC